MKCENNNKNNNNTPASHIARIARSVTHAICIGDTRRTTIDDAMVWSRFTVHDRRSTIDD